MESGLSYKEEQQIALESKIPKKSALFQESQDKIMKLYILEI